jgi:hypothetical protein
LPESFRGGCSVGATQASRYGRSLPLAVGYTVYNIVSTSSVSHIALGRPRAGSKSSLLKLNAAAGRAQAARSQIVDEAVRRRENGAGARSELRSHQDRTALVLCERRSAPGADRTRPRSPMSNLPTGRRRSRSRISPASRAFSKSTVTPAIGRSRKKATSPSPSVGPMFGVASTNVPSPTPRRLRLRRAVGVSCADALSKAFEAPHLGFNPNPCRVSGPVFPECSAIVSNRARDFISSTRGGTILLREPIVADPGDRGGLALWHLQMS